MQVNQFTSGNDPLTILSEKIREELFLSFKKNGIQVSSIIICMKDEKLNVKVNMTEEETRINLL